MDKKALYQEKVKQAVFDIAEYMISKIENGNYVGRSVTIREALKLNFYVYNEASGRLKAIGFHSGVKHFSKTKILERKDNEEYYYQVFPENSPVKIMQNKETAEKLDKRFKKLARQREIDSMLMLDVLDLPNNDD